MRSLHQNDLNRGRLARRYLVYTEVLIIYIDSAESGGDDKYLKKALEIHSMDNYDKQLQNEGLLSGWAADICRSEATQDLWRRATENR